MIRYDILYRCVSNIKTLYTVSLTGCYLLTHDTCVFRYVKTQRQGRCQSCSPKRRKTREVEDAGGAGDASINNISKAITRTESLEADLDNLISRLSDMKVTNPSS